MNSFQRPALLLVATTFINAGCDVPTVINGDGPVCATASLSADSVTGLPIAGAQWPSVISAADKVELFFTGANGTAGPTFRSTSVDGIHWSSPEEVLAAPFTTVFKDEDGYHAWFARGGGGSATPPSIGYASSSNGIEWVVSPDALFDAEAALHPNNARVELITRLAAWKIGATYHVAFEAAGTEIINDDAPVYASSIGHISGAVPSNLVLEGWLATPIDCNGGSGREGVRLLYSVTQPCSDCYGSIGVLVQRQGCFPASVEPSPLVEYVSLRNETFPFTDYPHDLGLSGTLVVNPDGDAIAIEVAPEGGALRAVRREPPDEVLLCAGGAG